MRQTMDKSKAARLLGRMFLRQMRRRRGVVEELGRQLNCCPIQIASAVKRWGSASCEFDTVIKIIKRLFSQQQKLQSRAFNLAYIVYERSSRAFRRLPKEKQKHLRDRGQFASTRRPPFAPWAESPTTA